MIKVMFVCHGNICRSPMAEFIFKDMVEKKGFSNEFYIASAATSREEIGNGVHYGTKQILDALGISSKSKRAVQITQNDYEEYDYIVVMDQRNIMNLNRIIGKDTENKVKRLLDYTENPGDIADPWYTGNFEVTYSDINEGCKKLLDIILRDTSI